MELSILYRGWFQCRLATDPDDFDHLRGQSGWTFALPGEPDFDRVIRFQNPIAPRTRGPAVGVKVSAVRLDDNTLTDHPLTGAAVQLMDNPVFEGRNGLVAPSAQEPIVPFSLLIQAGANSQLSAAAKAIDIFDPAQVQPRQPIKFTPISMEVAAETGISDPAKLRAERRTQLEQDLTTESDATSRQRLQRRITELAKTGIARNSLRFQLDYDFPLPGACHASTDLLPAGRQIDPAGIWRTVFWLGAWDADALTGFVKGRLLIPLK